MKLKHKILLTILGAIALICMVVETAYGGYLFTCLSLSLLVSIIAALVAITPDNPPSPEQFEEVVQENHKLQDAVKIMSASHRIIGNDVIMYSNHDPENYPYRAMEAINNERHRQIRIGNTTDIDDSYENGELVHAAICYESENGTGWPWAANSWKPKSREENLLRAGALYLAEADRAARAKQEDIVKRALNEVLKVAKQLQEIYLKR